MNINSINNYSNPQFKGTFVNSKVLQKAIKNASTADLQKFDTLLKVMNEVPDGYVFSVFQSARKGFEHINLKVEKADPINKSKLTQIGRIVPETVVDGYKVDIPAKKALLLTDADVNKPYTVEVIENGRSVEKKGILKMVERPKNEVNNPDYVDKFYVNIPPVLRSNNDNENIHEVLSYLVKNFDNYYGKALVADSKRDGYINSINKILTNE